MSELLSTVVNSFILGEFCEVQGPVVTQFLSPSSFHGFPEIINKNLWSPSLKETLEEIIMLCMNGDFYIYDDNMEKNEMPIMSFVIDNIPFEKFSANVHVVRINIPDIFARGYQRAICIAFISLEHHKSLSLSRWINEYCEMIIQHLFKGAHICYTRDIKQCKKALSILINNSNEKSLLSLRTLQSLEEEMESLKILESKNTNFTLKFYSSNLVNKYDNNKEELTIIKAIELAENLISRRGTVELRSLEIVCGLQYNESLDDMKGLLWYFSLDPSSLMEGALGTMPSTFSIFHYPFDKILKNNDIKESLSFKSFIFNVGECGVINPFIPSPILSLSYSLPSSTQFTLLNDPNLYNILRSYGPQNIINIAYNGLKCKTIIICGYDETSVIEAMKVACIFVPGLLQGKENTLRIGLQPLTSLEQLSANDIYRFAVVGCHVNSVYVNGVTRFPQVCTWQVGKKEKSNKCRTIKLDGEKYEFSKFKIRHKSSSLPVENEDIVYGLLKDFMNILRYKTLNTEQEITFSDNIRLLLKRVISDYCTLASLVLHNILTCHYYSHSTDDLSHLLLHSPKSCSKIMSNGIDNWPLIWSDEDTELTLHSIYGIDLASYKDIIIVTEIVKRMSIVMVHHCSMLI